MSPSSRGPSTRAAARTPPAAGAPGGAAPRLAGLRMPQFMRIDGAELVALLHVLRDPLAVHLYLLLLVQMRFTDGAFLSSYARLIDLMTPPAPEQGRRRAGPTYKQVRGALDALVSVGLVRRGDDNQAQGQLRLWLASRKSPVRTNNGKRAPVALEGRV